MCDVLLEALDSTDFNLVHFCLHAQQEQTIEGGGMLEWLETKGQDKGTPCGDKSMGCGNLSCQASKEWVAANHRMHIGMALKFTCDAEVDFVRGMIPHHVGAIEMCEILVKYTTPDEYLQELCVNITRVQRAEVYFLSEWLAARGQAMEARCDDGPVAPAPCEDVLLISEACHHLGGDGACKCSSLVQDFACGTMSTVNERQMNITDHCQRTCGKCPTRPASLVGSAKEVEGMDHGGGDKMDHDKMDHDKMDHDKMDADDMSTTLHDKMAHDNMTTTLHDKMDHDHDHSTTLHALRQLTDPLASVSSKLHCRTVAAVIAAFAGLTLA
jgi:uncharacterized protein (DUF305 family)